RYYGGWFKHDGDNTLFTEELDQNEFVEEPPVNHTIAGRVDVTPWEQTKGLLRRLQIGINVTSGEVDDGLFGMRGRTGHGVTVSQPTSLRGPPTRYGGDGLWTPGPFFLVADYNRVADPRNT